MNIINTKKEFEQHYLDVESLKSILSSKVAKEYKTMTDALADNTLPRDTFFRTHGYYSYGDGGGGVYGVTSYSPSDGNPCYITYSSRYKARYIFDEVANILALGAKCDNTGDNSSIIQGFANAVQTRRKKLFFPAGIYRCATPITITEKFTFEGAAPFRAGRAFWYNNVLNSFITSVLFFPATENNQTFITLNNISNGFGSMKNLCIASDSTQWNSYEWLTRPEVPYQLFSFTTAYTGVNGVNAETMSRLELDGCCFMGWSGYGTTVGQVFNFRDCYFDACDIGCLQTGTDAMLYDCYWTHCRIGIQACNGVLFCYNAFMDQCMENAIKGSQTGQTSLKFSGTIDHIGYAGIDLKVSYDMQLDARMGRCGMYYAGTTDLTTLTQDYATLAKASTVSVQTLNHGVLNLSVYLRDITDTDQENYALPLYLLNGESWEKAVVFTASYDEYAVCSPLFSATSEIGVYSFDGFHQYPLVGE